MCIADFSSQARIFNFLFFNLFLLQFMLLRHEMLLYKWNSSVDFSEKRYWGFGFVCFFPQEMNAPSFRVEKNEDGSMHLHYYSDRRGLCHIVPGNEAKCRVQINAIDIQNNHIFADVFRIQYLFSDEAWPWNWSLAEFSVQTPELSISLLPDHS